jgi:hypothetical protein
VSPRTRMDVFNKLPASKTGPYVFEELLFGNGSLYHFLVSSTQKIKTQKEIKFEESYIEFISSDTDFEIVSEYKTLGSENKRINFFEIEAHALDIPVDKIVNAFKYHLIDCKRDPKDDLKIVPAMMNVSFTKSEFVFPDSKLHEITVKYLNVITHDSVGGITFKKYWR